MLIASEVWSVHLPEAFIVSEQFILENVITLVGSWHCGFFFYAFGFNLKKDLMLTKQPLIWFDSSSMDECNYREPPMCRTFYHRFVRHPVYMTTVNMQISILLMICHMHIILVSDYYQKAKIKTANCKTGKLGSSTLIVTSLP